MAKSINKLLAMHKYHEHVSNTEIKRNEIELIQKVILAKETWK